MRVNTNTVRSRVATGVAAVGCLGCAVWFALLDHSELLNPLTLALFASVVFAGFAITRWDRGLAVSGAFISQVMAIGLLGPAAACAIETLAELPVWLAERYRRAVLTINLFAVAAPNLIAASLFVALDPSGAAFYAALAGAAVLYLSLNYLIVSVLMGALDGERILPRLRPFFEMAPSTAINIVLALATTAIYRQVGLGAAIFALASVIAFTYMARLVVKAEDRAESAREQATIARERTRQYAALSWGVLSGLIRTLNERDPRAARHAAAVAAFARDIAAGVGMSDTEQELAHTAGLLHDIGRFGLSDRVMERDVKLTDEDWTAIRRHPELGADMLKDLGVYGPVADIVRHHHERIDGRGYPDKLGGDDIPEIAKIVAVAEVYDTLTADDTYRTPVSSFQALNELRRVSGSQLEPRYVEALSSLLAGSSTAYRHADSADFDRELDLERRISGAEAPDDDADAPAARSA